MTNSRRDDSRIVGVLLAAAFGIGTTTTACTPATPDTPIGGSGGQSTIASGGSTATGGSVGTVGTGGSVAAGSGGSTGSGGSPAGSSGGQVGSGGSPVGNSGGSVGSGGSAVGTGGMVTTGGRPGSGGSMGSGGAGGTTATGCNWVHNTTDDTWAFAAPAPADKIVLFDGSSLSGWHSLAGITVPAPWKLIGDGSMEVLPQATPTNIQSNMKFEDLCLHVEYMTPVFPSTTTDPQKRGNSGVYLKSAYEMQILDTTNSAPVDDGCGSVYKVRAPLVVACKMYLVWNTYDIEFKSSVWSGAAKTKDAVFVRVALNGKLVQLDVPLNPAGGFTQAGIPDVAGPQPIALQDHRDLVRFKNIWATVPRY